MKEIIFTFLLIFFVSCTESETSFTKDDILSMGTKIDKDFKFIVPARIGTVLVNCHEYRPKCLVGYKAKAKLIEFNALYYGNSKDAFESALTFDGYHSSNWSFDYVSGEPILERFVQKAFNAKKVK